MHEAESHEPFALQGSVNVPVMTIAIGVLVLALAAAIAAIIPARRAASIDPVKAFAHRMKLRQ
jgi:ABC-type antimicrobial peptide transport system permease subunit